MKAHTGKASISRYTSRDGYGISIELRDDSSGVQVVRIEMTPEAFGNAVTGLGFQECTFELYEPALVGKKHEHKTELVPFNGWDFSNELKQSAVECFEVDGWKAYLPDIGNGHRRVGDKGYHVSFHRYV